MQLATIAHLRINKITKLYNEIILVLNLRGGTNTDMAPQIDAFTEILLPNLKQFGPEIEFEVK